MSLLLVRQPSCIEFFSSNSVFRTVLPILWNYIRLRLLQCIAQVLAFLRFCSP